MKLPSGFQARPFAGPSDYPLMAELINVCNRADSVDDRTSVSEIETNYRNLDNSDPATDMIMVVRGDELVAYTRSAWWQETTGPRVSIVWAHVHPEVRATGVAAALFDWAERRGREVAAGAAADKVFDGWADARNQAEITRIYEERGYEPITYTADMVRPDLEAIPEWSLPDGVELRPVEDGHLRQIWDAAVEAFRDHWGFSEPTEASYQRFLEDPYRDESLWKIAWSGDRVVGQVRSFIKPDQNQALGRARGYTEDISTVKEFRRRGIARALICASLEELRQQGMEEAALGVHTENPNGAFTLYESLGFEVKNLHTVYRKPF